MNCKDKKRSGMHIRIRMWFGGYKQACATNTRKSLDVKNFLGGKQIKHIDMIEGVTCAMNPDVKDEIVFKGFDNAALSLCCARVCQSVKVGKKDERKFLDGIFVSNKSVIEAREE